MRPLNFLVIGAIVAALAVGIGSNRLGGFMDSMDNSCRGYAVARAASQKDMQPYLTALVSYVVARNLLHGDTSDLEQDLNENVYLQDAVAWLDDYCPGNIEVTFSRALKHMVRQVEAD